jgi:hypothetical protein
MTLVQTAIVINLSGTALVMFAETAWLLCKVIDTEDNRGLKVVSLLLAYMTATVACFWLAVEASQAQFGPRAAPDPTVIFVDKDGVAQFVRGREPKPKEQAARAPAPAPYQARPPHEAKHKLGAQQ